MASDRPGPMRPEPRVRTPGRDSACRGRPEAGDPAGSRNHSGRPRGGGERPSTSRSVAAPAEAVAVMRVRTRSRRTSATSRPKAEKFPGIGGTSTAPSTVPRRSRRHATARRRHRRTARNRAGRGRASPRSRGSRQPCWRPRCARCLRPWSRGRGRVARQARGWRPSQRRHRAGFRRPACGRCRGARG